MSNRDRKLIEAREQIAELKAKTNWRRMETATPEDYETVLALVRSPDGDLVHRMAMWDPENGDWTVFMANWDTAPEYWMPLEPPPSD